jgi:4-aminobutyrate aminotransferase-like enzyme/Ser/Thr protein kinase RdoA (MazF antagonist)/murein DD-endopeptidase MepM/ murein hydrolase activator NlpD
MTDAERIARERFGIAGRAKPLHGELDLNFSIDGHVLKIYAPGTDRARLDLQDAALEHLAGDPAVPRLVRTRDGAPRVEAIPAARVSPRSGHGGTRRHSSRLARMLTWVPGTPWAAIGEHGPESLRSLGRTVARVDRALASFEHPALDTRRWNMLAAADLLDGAEGAAAAVLERFADELLPRLRALPAQAIHNDANEHNVLVGAGGEVCGLIDFGDLCRAPRVCGLAVACAYAMTTLPVPERQVVPLVAGYHEVAPLAPEELALLPDLIRTRLAMSVRMAAIQRREQPGNEYLLISQDAVPGLLRRLGPVAPEIERLRLRAACGYEAVPHARAVRAFLAATDAGPVCDPPLHDAPVIDFSGEDPPAPTATPAIGRYLEQRSVYDSPAFATELPGERRTLHLGVDVFLDAGAPVLAPLDGVVGDSGFRPAARDYGGVVLLDHQTPDGVTFHTLYGHLSADVPPPGTRFARGDVIGHLGAEEDNGGWAPHLHLQLLTTELGEGCGVHGVGTLAERDLWESVSPDPNLLLGLPGGVRADPPRASADVLAARRVSLSRALSVSYAEPLRIVRGEGAHLYDEHGTAYLDLVNNVCHVGHAHPRVVRAAAEQMARLNTNTRYLHDLIVTYARRLTATLPDALSVVFLVNSGSEANDLALRLARAHTGARDVLVLDHAYHGNLSSLVEISPYKFAGPGGSGRPEHVHVCRLPHGAGDADDVRRHAERVAPAAFVAESLPGVAGQIVLPDGYLATAYEHARAAGAVCIADEVQVGFGRVGSAFWGFELGGVVPDVVTLGKPIGNGHPIGAVVTTPQIARSFETGMEYFNTFGGNPVSCAAALAVLDVIADERLQAHAARLGAWTMDGLRELASRHPQITDVRGAGLFIGVELTGPDEAAAVVEHARRAHVLLSTDGPRRNVLKVKPPLAIGDADAERFLEVLDGALSQRP